VSAELTGAWHDGLNIHIVGLFDGAVVNTADVVVDATGPTHVELNWSGLDMLEFTSSGGVLHDPDWLEGAMFVMDDAVVTGVPVSGVTVQSASPTPGGTGTRSSPDSTPNVGRLRKPRHPMNRDEPQPAKMRAIFVVAAPQTI
jgi:hypothetical protein